jgi:hypothetical protein
MWSRALTCLPGSLALALLAFLLVEYQASALASALAAGLALIAGTALHFMAGDARIGRQRQLNFGAALFALHAVSLYTFGHGPSDSPVTTTTQALLAAVGAFACALVANRMLKEATVRHAPATAREEEDPDATLELNPRETTSRLPTLMPPPSLRRSLTATVAFAALLALATVYWLEDGTPSKDALGSASATEPPRVLASDPIEVTVPVEPPPVVEAPPEAPPVIAEAPVQAPPVRGIAPSAARRECMAQIESARLFLQIAREAPDESAYSRSTSEQIARMLETRPVGPRTLARIAERMWALRESPERESAWWSGQFARCETARSSGSWYVVRG